VLALWRFETAASSPVGRAKTAGMRVRRETLNFILMTALMNEKVRTD
jgi:hypothetical protein